MLLFIELRFWRLVFILVLPVTMLWYSDGVFAASVGFTGGSFGVDKIDWLCLWDCTYCRDFLSIWIYTSAFS